MISPAIQKQAINVVPAAPSTAAAQQPAASAPDADVIERGSERQAHGHLTGRTQLAVGPADIQQRQMDLDALADRLRKLQEFINARTKPIR